MPRSRLYLYGALCVAASLPHSCATPVGSATPVEVPRPTSPNSDAGERQDLAAARPSYEEATQDPSTDELNWPPPVQDDAPFSFFLFDQLEFRENDAGPDALRWDAQGWYGTDRDKIWLRTEGDSNTSGPTTTDAEAQLLYSRMISPFWDVQLGVRYDRRFGSSDTPSRWFGVLGLQGFAPYRFDVEPALFVSEDGDVSARLTATTDWLLTQNWILQPRFEGEAAAQDAVEFGVGEGVEYVELGLRLRYEVRRELAPYVGLEWERLFGETADLARDSGDDDSTFSFVVGLRAWL